MHLPLLAAAAASHAPRRRLVVSGCMDPTASNFNPSATSYCCCSYTVVGCTDSTAVNYLPEATSDSDGCVARIAGCMDPTASNYNPSANTRDDALCTWPNGARGCRLAEALNYRHPRPLIEFDLCVL